MASAVDYRLDGKTAIVTGGAAGIGGAIVDLFAASGARVHVWDVQPAARNDVASTRVDVTNAPSIAAAVDAFARLGARPDILVNNAGYLGALGAFPDHDPDDWLRVLNVNLIGAMQVTRAVVPLMRRAGGGRIVNLGSLAGKEGLPKLAAYSAASAGVIAFTKALAQELVDAKIFVNCVAPGPIDTTMIRSLGEPAVSAMIANSPMKRLGRPEEVAQLVAWLCSDASAFNTGAVFDMSGGRARY